ncbi:helix-turn-helix domain-containing protein [Actinoallomurus sp. NPDC050550]|uniref:helix-turn-helix domain-containing protein n=1 Tax=Actinoallomurus sp. NPDC050550 TaxID=3154937 RepID=UPI0033FBA61D
MPTLSALVHQLEPRLRLLVEPVDETAEVESAVVLSDGDPLGWPDADLAALSGVLVILSVRAETRGDVAETVRRLGEIGAAGVVLVGGVTDPADIAESARRHRIPLLAASDDPSHVWAAVTAVLREERKNDHRHATNLRELHRDATLPGGLERLVRRLAQQVGGSVVLLDQTGEPLHAFPRLPGDVLDQVAQDLERVRKGVVRAAAADLGTGVVHIQSLGEGEAGTILVVAREQRFSPAVRSLIMDASRLVELRRRVDVTDLQGRRLNQAEAHTREAVLHLLMVGQVEAARRVSGALGPPLADSVRVYIVECPPGVQGRVGAYFNRVSGGRAWIVRCPVYTGHVIVIGPAADEVTEAEEEALRTFAACSGGIHIGCSGIVALREIASGYSQAFHALAVARGSAGRYSRFSPRGDLAALLRPRAQAWAREALGPLSQYRPDRAQDPDGPELTATLRSWLDFYGGAARQMKIHRNTLAARLRHIERLLGSPLHDLPTQARLHLALRVLDGAGGGDPVPVDVLLDDPHVRHWSRLQVSPLLEGGRGPLLQTLRVWLDHDGRLEATASALGISVPGTRKRLGRVEEILERSLLRGPSARYDMWFALRAYDG